MKVTLQLSFKQVQTAAESSDYVGFCVSCGYEQYGVEPDAREYECEECKSLTVFGAEQLLLEGQFEK